MKAVRARHSRPKLVGEPSVERVDIALGARNSPSFLHLFQEPSLRAIGRMMSRILTADTPIPWAFF